MQEYMRACVEIDMSALRYNLAVLKAKSAPSAILVILKSNAYGHGIIRTAKALPHAEGFGVAYMSEALALRQAGITQKIVLLEGCFAANEYLLASEHQLDVVIHNEEQLNWLMDNTHLKSLTIWLKVNTGMNRLGFAIEQLPIVWKKLNACTLIREVVLMSQLAFASQPTHPITLSQVKTFQRIVEQFQSQHYIFKKSLANSAALLTQPPIHYEWVRPGLSLYGVSPIDENPADYYNLKPVMTLKAKIIAIQTPGAGETIGYQARYECQQPKRIGVVSIGYGDGYPQNAPDGTPVFVNNTYVPMTGQVSMDMLTIDLSTQPKVKVGEPVTLWGKNLPIERIAQYTQRSTYELLCGIEREINQRLQIAIQ